MKKNNIIVKKKQKGLTYLYINRPKVKNALNIEMIDEIKETLKVLKSDSSVRVLIITGKDDCFSSGADLKWMESSKKLDFKDNKRDAIKFAEMLKEIEEFPKPTISLVNGHAFGGALGIIAVTDYSIADKNAKFSFSEVKLGIIPAMIGPYILRNIGLKNCKKLFLTGEIFDAVEAKEINLINEILTPDLFDNYISILFLKLLKGSPKAQTEIKKFLIAINSKYIDKDLIDKTAEEIARIRISEEAQEGLNAFLEKRKPGWI